MTTLNDGPHERIRVLLLLLLPLLLIQGSGGVGLPESGGCLWQAGKQASKQVSRCLWVGGDIYGSWLAPF